MAVPFVQGNSGYDAGPITLTGTTAGNTLIVLITGYDPLTSTTLPAGWQKQTPVAGPHPVSACVWVYPNCPGGNVSVTPTSMTTDPGWSIHEYSGVFTTTPIESYATNSVLGATNWTSSPVDASAGGCVFIGVAQEEVATTMSVTTSGFVRRTGEDSHVHMTCDNDDITAGPHTASGVASSGVPVNYVTVAVALTPVTVAVAGSNYTELEWNLTLQAPAAGGDVYEFRVYAGSSPLDTYPVTPQMTATVAAVASADPATITLTGQTATASATGTATTTAGPATLTLTGQTATATATGTVTRTADPATLTLTGVTPGEQPMVALITCAVTGPGLRRIVTGPSNQPVAAITGPSNQPVAAVTGPDLSRDATGPAHSARLAAGPDVVAVPVAGPDLSRDVTGPGMEHLMSISGPGVGTAQPGTVDSPTAVLTGVATGPGLGRTVTGPVTDMFAVTGPSNQPQASVTGPAATARNLTGPAHLTRVATGPGVESLHVTGPELSVDVMGPAMEDELVLTGPGVCNGN